MTVSITTDPPYNDWWVFVDGRHADNGEPVPATVTTAASSRWSTFGARRAAPVADLFVDKTVTRACRPDEDVDLQPARAQPGKRGGDRRRRHRYPAVGGHLRERNASRRLHHRDHRQPDRLERGRSFPPTGSRATKPCLELTVRFAASVVVGLLVTNTLASPRAGARGRL